MTPTSPSPHYWRCDCPEYNNHAVGVGSCKKCGAKHSVGGRLLTPSTEGCCPKNKAGVFPTDQHSQEEMIENLEKAYRQFFEWLDEHEIPKSLLGKLKLYLSTPTSEVKFILEDFPQAVLFQTPQLLSYIRSLQKRIKELEEEKKRLVMALNGLLHGVNMTPHWESEEMCIEKAKEALSSVTPSQHD